MNACAVELPRRTTRTHDAVIPFERLEPTEHSYEVIEAEHGDVPFSVILVHSKPGVGPKLHRHPYPEVFIVESGEATFQLGHETIVVRGGHVVVGPSQVKGRTQPLDVVVVRAG